MARAFEGRSTLQIRIDYHRLQLKNTDNSQRSQRLTFQPETTPLISICEPLPELVALSLEDRALTVTDRYAGQFSPRLAQDFAPGHRPVRHTFPSR